MVTKHSIKKIGKALKKELEKGYNVEALAIWAWEKRISVDLTDDADAVLKCVALMDAGPEFKFSYEELKNMMEKMIQGENPFEDSDSIIAASNYKL